MGFVLAMIAKNGSAGINDFTEEALGDEDLRRFGEKVEMVLDPEVDAAYPRRWIGLVEIETTDGGRFTSRVETPKGDPGNTLGREELEEKARSLAALRGRGLRRGDGSDRRAHPGPREGERRARPVAGGFGVSRPDRHEELRRSVREVCDEFPDAYWRGLDAKREYPEEFVRAMSEKRYLAALIPEEYGGSGMNLTQASVILEEINRSGGNAQPAHAQVYTMGTLLRHGSEEQKKEYLPKIASGEFRLQAFGVTEPEAGTDTTQLTTTAVRDGDDYVINGRKIYISRVQHSDYMILLARTTPLDEVKRKSEGLSSSSSTCTRPSATASRSSPGG